jgi:hypothetical protein
MKGMLRAVAALFFLCLSFIPFIAEASFLSALSDQISWSVPSATSTHRIRFGAVNAIPPSGTILLYHDDGALNIPAGLDFTDIDFAVGASSTGPFVDRTIGASADAVTDGIAIVSGGVGGVSQILITLNSTTGIAAGEFMEIEIGSNATNGGTGDDHLQNPSVQGSYRIRVLTRTPGNTDIDYGSMMYAIVQPVQAGPGDTTDVVPPTRSNGLPSGALPASTLALEISLNTDKYAFCRYGTASGTPYESIASLFSKTNNTLHRQLITGLVQGASYEYYVRCGGVALGSATNTDDYLISFSIGTTASSSASSTPTPPPPPPTPSGGGSGGGGGGGNFLGKADVMFGGNIFPIGAITLLKDGKVEFEFASDVSGAFSTTRYGYERGPQSFSMYAVDGNGRKTSTYTGTMYLIANTTNYVGPIYLSPTISVASTTVDIGGAVRVEGMSIPNYLVEVFMEKQGGKGESNIVRATATSTATGVWSVNLPTSGLSRGTYQVKARSIISAHDQSIYSPLAYVGVGESPTPDFGLRADLNKDKKVNLVDFSILLFNWKTGDTVADINQDGDVNLQDFSIMLFQWTG